MLTWLFELPVALVLAPRRNLRLVFVVVAASVVTHPGIWWLGTHLPTSAWWAGICTAEVVVGVVEGVIVWRCAPMAPAKALIIGLLMNGVSFASGLLLF